MVVAVDVRTMDQMLLLPAGCRLAQKQIGSLQTWGITDVEVEVNDDFVDRDDPLTELPPEEVARLTTATKALFWQLDETDLVEMEIYKLVLRRAARRRLAESTQP